MSGRCLITLLIEVITNKRAPESAGGDTKTNAVRKICHYVQRGVFKREEGGFAVQLRFVRSIVIDSRMSETLLELHPDFDAFFCSIDGMKPRLCSTIAVNNVRQQLSTMGNTGLRKIVRHPPTRGQVDTYLYFVSEAEAVGER